MRVGKILTSRRPLDALVRCQHPSRESCTHALYGTCEHVLLVAGILLDMLRHCVEHICENTIEQRTVVGAHFSGTVAEGGNITLGDNQDFIVAVVSHDEG